MKIALDYRDGNGITPKDIEEFKSKLQIGKIYRLRVIEENDIAGKQRQRFVRQRLLKLYDKFALFESVPYGLKSCILYFNLNKMMGGIEQ